MKKMLPWLITILLAITLIAIVAVILFNSLMGGDDSKDAVGKAANNAEAVKVVKLTADERVKLTSEITDIKTNLADPEYIAVLGLAFQLDEKSTKEDFDKIKDIQIKPIIIRTLSDMKPDEVKGSAGKDELCAKLLNLINQELPEGKLIKVQVTNFIVTTL
ncbi:MULTISPECIES: flagellar basal body-associated FliL family protein [Paenibacillus]|uniref:Flagellar protein FliL n=1 Tax=Paenibacillus lignilyticus TaxID=1172615 RepID=A0ABS5CH91_9BACL|nr:MULTISPECIES: flagellar basal body-associated FliL family protein [Paenibacillus]MBP3965250.1 flagellar basal body-associated FliL family protein [Paenibacillus lignilyticus]SFS79275.1 flagellar FliL protein [Paenibacillus sp. BC26]